MLSEKELKHIRDKFDNWELIDFESLPEEWATESLLREYKDKIEWYSVLRRFFLNENFLIEMIEDGTLSDVAIKEMISPFQILSEKFMEKYKDRIDWVYVSASQKMSEEFMDKYAERLDFYSLSLYRQFSPEFIERHENKWNWLTIVERQKNVPKNLIQKHRQEIPSWLYVHIMLDE